MVEKIPGLPDNVLGFTAKGTVTADDYESVIIPMFRRFTLCVSSQVGCRMGVVSHEKIQGHTPEKWAEDFERIVDHVLRPKR